MCIICGVDTYNMLHMKINTKINKFKIEVMKDFCGQPQPPPKFIPCFYLIYVSPMLTNCPNYVFFSFVRSLLMVLLMLCRCCYILCLKVLIQDFVII